MFAQFVNQKDLGAINSPIIHANFNGVYSFLHKKLLIRITQVGGDIGLFITLEPKVFLFNSLSTLWAVIEL